MNEPVFKLSRVKGSPVSNEELIIDLQRVAQLNSGVLPQRQYTALGQYDCTTAIRRFGSWNEALRLAGVALSNEHNISDETLFENILVLWQHLGRQPRRSELAAPPSTISQSPYNRRFGSWTATLEAFVDYANGNGVESIETHASENTTRRATGRDPSIRLRWFVLQRDRFTCRACGASPAISQGVELHVDHILAWSRGGDTVLENLQTLCAVCNLGKSDT
ncbi:MAG: HNH endonuclease [Gallionellaceae bacterium]|jgi:hypothetical protein